MVERPRVVLGIPLERTVPSTAFVSFLAIVQQGWPFIGVPYTRTDVARNLMAQEFLESDFTHLLMLDLDHKHPADVVQRLTRWLSPPPNLPPIRGEESDRPFDGAQDRLVIGGLCFRRSEPYDPMVVVRGEDGEAYTLADWMPGLIKCETVGHGAILIAREALERVPGPPWWWYDYAYARDGAWPTEDMAFCRACREAGIDIYCDTTTVSPHLGERWIDDVTFKEFLERADGGEPLGVELSDELIVA